MKIREALGIIATMDAGGNRPGSDRQATGFTNEVINLMRNVDHIIERPNGRNGYPTFQLKGIDYQIKTAKGSSPMWNEVYIRTNSVLILNLSFGTVVVHGSLITDNETQEMLIKAKEYVAQHMRTKFPKGNKNFHISGARVQFGDNIDWAGSRLEWLNQTIKILE